MEQRLIQIITNLRNACRAEDLNISDNTLFSEACSFLRGEFAGESRKIQSPNNTKNFNKSPAPANSPTPAQLSLLKKNESRLKKMNIEISSIKTKLEASKIIDGLIKNGE
jgi:hypothetical protein